MVVPQQVELGSLTQDHFVFEKTPLIEVVLQGNKRLWKARQEKQALLLHEPFGKKECDQLAKLEQIIEEEGGYAAEGGSRLLEGLGIPEERHFDPLELLSGGYKLRVLLAQVFRPSRRINFG